MLSSLLRWEMCACVRVLNDATVQLYETFLQWDRVYCYVLAWITWGRTQTQFVCAQHKNTKASSFVTRSDVSVLLLENQPSSRRTKRRPFWLSHLYRNLTRYEKLQRSPCRFSFLGNGAIRAASDRTDWWITAERKALGCVNADNDFPNQQKLEG